MSGVELTGYVRPTEAECIQEIVDEARATVDDEFDDSPDSATGQLVNIVGSKWSESFEVLEAVYASLSTLASGRGLDRVAAITNSKRRAASYTLLTVNLTGSNGSYAVGDIDLTVDGQPTVHFSNRDTLVISGGTGTGVFISDTSGVVRVSGGTLGPNVTSFTELSIGRPVETDAELRIRRIQELADAGTGTTGALRAALSKLDNVKAVRVYTNRSMVDLSGVGGQPPKSVEALVIVASTAPDAVQPVIDTIWANLPAGIQSYGQGSDYYAVDEEGHAQLVKLTIASAASKYVRVSMEIEDGAYPGDAVTKQVIADFTAGLLSLDMSNGNPIAGGIDLGGTIYRSRIAAAALTVPGVTGVTKVEIGNSAGTVVDADLVLDPREYLGVGGGLRGFEIGHITVVTT
jgi:hypothetical protein